MSAYLISDLIVLDGEAFENYRTRAAEAIAKYGGRYLARGGEIQTLEGTWNPGNIVVAEFTSLDQARAWYRSPEYAQAARIPRQGAKPQSHFCRWSRRRHSQTT